MQELSSEVLQDHTNKRFMGSFRRRLSSSSSSRSRRNYYNKFYDSWNHGLRVDKSGNLLFSPPLRSPLNF